MSDTDIDYGSHLPAGHEDGHTAGLRLPRVAARTHAEHGRAAVGSLYEAIEDRAFEAEDSAELGATLRRCTCRPRRFPM